MKNFTKKIATATVATIMISSVLGQDIDLVPGINYDYAPIDGQGIINIDYVDVCNNGNDNADPFQVTMYLYDENTEDVYFIANTELTNGLSGNACISVENWNIDVNDTPGVPAGTYRLGIWVDSDEDITETDEDNNTGLLAGNNNYSPSTANIEVFNNQDKISVYPNPAVDFINIDVDTDTKIESHVSLFNLNGQEVLSFDANDTISDNGLKIDVSNMEKGIYVLKFVASGEMFTKKVIVK